MDMIVYQRSKQVIRCADRIAELYRVLARRTIKLAKRKHPDRDYTEMEEILR